MVINTDPSSQQHTIVLVCIVSPIVTSLFVAIRVWTRTFVSHWVGWDDYVALITWVSTSTCWPLLTATLLMRFEKLCCIGYSVLIGLGVILLPLLQACIAHRT